MTSSKCLAGGAFVLVVLACSAMAQVVRFEPEPTDLILREAVPFKGAYLLAGSNGLQQIQVPSLEVVQLAAEPVGEVVVAGNLAYFTKPNNQELWVSDGTGPGTKMLTQGNTYQLPRGVLTDDDILLFLASHPEESSTSYEVWHSDGTMENTQFAYGLSISETESFGIAFQSDGKVLIPKVTVYETEFETTVFGDLCVSDGSPEGTGQFHSFGEGILSELVYVGGAHLLLFESAESIELWRSDGSISGTFLLSEIIPIKDPSREYYASFHKFGETQWIYTRSCDGSACEHGWWRTDGTVDGTQPLVIPGVDWSGDPFLSNTELIAVMDENTAFVRVTDLPNNRDVFRMINMSTGDGVDVFGPRMVIHTTQQLNFPALVRGDTVYFWLTADIATPRGGIQVTEPYAGLVAATNATDSATFVLCAEDALITHPAPTASWLTDLPGGIFALMGQQPHLFLRETDAPCENEETGQHSADIDGDYVVTLGELLRLVQFYNSGGYRCASEGELTEDGFVPGNDGELCRYHDADYLLRSGTIELTELLRLIQFYNSLGFHYCPAQYTEDGFCPGLA